MLHKSTALRSLLNIPVEAGKCRLPSKNGCYGRRSSAQTLDNFGEVDHAGLPAAYSKERWCRYLMSAVYVLSKSGGCLMPTTRYRHVRRLLKDGKARICSRNPFAIQLTYDSVKNTQPIEIGIDAGYEHIGVSVKSAKQEYFSAQFDLLKNEKQHHDDCREHRRTRRNNLRHRPCRYGKDTKPEGWIPPSLRHKAEAHIRIAENICKVAPIRKVTVEVGEFDPALLKAMQTGKEPPQGKDYQHGPLYFADSLRAAVFHRDGYTCQICGKSAITSKEPVYLHTHHALYWKGRHADTMDELITVCSNCHTPENHQKGGKLWGLTPDVPRLEGATFMNVVRWRIVDALRNRLTDVEVCHTYGAVTARKRKEHGIKKSHASDAFCIGDFLPVHRAKTEHYKKRRRNNRILEKFYDAKIIDIRDGSAKAGKDLGCNRTNRREPRNSEKNLRIFRGEYLRHGKRAIRKQRYPIQAGDIVMAKGKIYCCHGMMSGGKSVLLMSAKESPTKKAVTASPKKVTLIRHASGWVKM